MKETLVTLNTIKMFGIKVSVALAKYDKDHKRFNYASVPTGKSEWRPKSNHQDNSKLTGEKNYEDQSCLNKNIPAQGPSGPAFVQDGMSYADMLKGRKEVQGMGAKTITVDGKGSLYPLHCIGRSVIGIARAELSISMVKLGLEKEGMFEVGLSYIGGMMYIKSAIESMEVHANFFLQEFSNFYLWNGEEIPFSRIVTLNIVGVPFIIRDNVLYDKIGGLFGEVVQGSSFSWQDKDNSSGLVKVLTSQKSRIEESVVIKWVDKSIVIWISEIYGQRRMVEVDNDTSADFDEAESEEVSDSDEDVEDMDDYEEGEIRSMLKDDENMHVGDNPPVTAEASPVGTEQTREGLETLADQETIDINVALEKSSHDINDNVAVHGEGNPLARDNNINGACDCRSGGLNNMDGGGPDESNFDINNIGPKYPCGEGTQLQPLTWVKDLEWTVVHLLLVRCKDLHKGFLVRRMYLEMRL
ncbi:hypothetical protein Hdeb2414_s0007g00245481 [Helianthus debilis subsp. tardiflorus]